MIALAIIALVPEVALTEALLRLTSRAPRLFGDFRVIWDNLTGGNRSACELLVPYRMCANPPLVRVGSRRRGPAPGRRRSCREAADRRLLRSRTMAEGLGVFFSNAGPTGRARGIGTATTFNGTHRPVRQAMPRGRPAWSASGRVSRTRRLRAAVRNCTRDEGGPFEVGNQVLTSSHRKLLSSKAMVVNVAET